MQEPKTLTSVQNPRVRELVRLRETRHRADSKRFLIDGPREIERAFDAGWDLPEIFYCPELLQVRENSWEGLLARLGSRGEMLSVSPRVWEKIAFGNRRDGVLAVGIAPEFTLAKLELKGSPLVVVLEAVEKPGNLGAVLRSADAVQASAVLLADPQVDVLNPNVIRASAGTVFHVPIAVDTSAMILSFLKEHHLNILVAHVGAERSIYDVEIEGGIAVVLGNEARGVTGLWDSAGARSVRLPMLGRADSLNVSVTAAVMLYELQRRRGALK
jgi:RNA methyltransferase, TrmH family